jgi:hypothetical protein
MNKAYFKVLMQKSIWSNQRKFILLFYDTKDIQYLLPYGRMTTNNDLCQLRKTLPQPLTGGTEKKTRTTSAWTAGPPGI